MKESYLLRASIIAALAAVPLSSFADAYVSGALAGISTAEASRVTQTVNNQVVSLLPSTHLGLLGNLTATGSVPDSAIMNHMQLILRPSAQRAQALQSLIADQHNPNSPRFHQWLAPAQYGQAFGVVDSDAAAVKAWLASQGFTVNVTYPNNTEIDFSGTAGQVRQAFHTHEMLYMIDGATHIANDSDISVPTSLQPILAGVMGLNDFRPVPMHVPKKIATYNDQKHSFSLIKAQEKADPLAVLFSNGGVRGLVPNDFANMYGIMPIRRNGVTGKGITIALVEDEDMVTSDWTNFVGQFNLTQYGGTFTQFQPNVGSTTNCYDPDNVYHYAEDGTETLMDAEYSSGMAPSANVEVASCSDYDPSFNPVGSNYFEGVFVAAANLINGGSRPDIISVSYGWGEQKVDSASKAAIDLMWAQADAEGISVFVASGDSGSNPSFNGTIIYGNSIDANALATSPNVTAVGGTDTADVLDGTTSEYFNSTPNAAYGTAKGYVPEIPWNQSCGNGVAATAKGYANVIDFCEQWLAFDPEGDYGTSEAGGGGPSSVDAKPTWQRLVTGAASDQSRDVPDVALFAGSFGEVTWAILCTNYYPCMPNFTSPVELEGGTSLASPMMAGIQALIDQGIAMRGLPADQGNAAPTLYALAGQEYGTGRGSPPSSLAACNADNGNNGTSGCVFHNVTRGSISTNCLNYAIKSGGSIPPSTNCYYYGAYDNGEFPVGLTVTNTSAYTPATKAYGAQPGWSFASGLGSLNATNLLIAWRAFVNAPPASLTVVSK